MNIHLPAILGFTRYQGFDPSPLIDWINYSNYDLTKDGQWDILEYILKKYQECLLSWKLRALPDRTGDIMGYDS